MGPQNHLTVTVVQDAQEAIEKGFNYAAKSDEYKPIEITKVVVVRDGTMERNPTVDLVLTDEAGQKYVVMVTGALLKSIPC